MLLPINSEVIIAERRRLSSTEFEIVFYRFGGSGVYMYWPTISYLQLLLKHYNRLGLI